MKYTFEVEVEKIEHAQVTDRSENAFGILKRAVVVHASTIGQLSVECARVRLCFLPGAAHDGYPTIGQRLVVTVEG